MTNQTIKDLQVTTITDLGKEMWAYLTGKGAAINYEFVDMTIECRARPGRRPLGPSGGSTARCASPRRRARRDGERCRRRALGAGRPAA